MSDTEEGIYNRNQYLHDCGKSWEDKDPKNVVEGAEKKSRTCQNLQGASTSCSWDETTKAMEGCWPFIAATSLSCQPSVRWRPEVTFDGQGQHQEGGKSKNKLAPSSTPGSDDNLQSIMTAASLPRPRTHTVFTFRPTPIWNYMEKESLRNVVPRITKQTIQQSGTLVF